MERRGISEKYLPIIYRFTYYAKEIFLKQLISHLHFRILTQ